jgi:hypothetical protein
MISDWIDDLCDRWGEINYQGKSIRSFRIYKGNAFPKKIEPEDLPCAITIIEGTDGNYTAGGSWEYTIGRTEFHVTPTLDNLAEAIDFHPLIRNKLHEGIQLGAKLDHIRLIPGAGGQQIDGPVELQFGEEPPHYGFVVNWEAKENVSDEILAAA